MLKHGGNLLAAAAEENIPIDEWLDLSTGISPTSYPIPAIPDRAWHRLPEDEDNLLDAAHHYYGTSNLIATAGSQAALQVIPRLRHAISGPSRVAFLKPSYNEHAHAWATNGHSTTEFTSTAELLDAACAHDVIVLCNPNNPTGHLWNKEELLSVHRTVSSNGGWLIVDEAFIDSQPGASIISHTGAGGLIVLRSMGKFFGLAGMRMGFVAAWTAFLQEIQEALGPWTIAGPSRFVATTALMDTEWHATQCHQLRTLSDRLKYALNVSGYEPAGSTDYFHWITPSHATDLHRQWRQQGILTRLFEDPTGIRIGLATTEDEYRILEEVLSGAIVR